MGKMEKPKRIKEAAALKYSPEKDNAPVIVALGKGEAAEKIVETAEENKVPVHKDDNLAHALSTMNIGDEIPRELYGIVAEILIFVSGIDKSYGEKYGSK